MHTMQRIHIHLTDAQLERLKAISEETGLGVAELIRRYIDAGIKGWDKGTNKSKGD
jgi:predicted DNA-binding protein